MQCHKLLTVTFGPQINFLVGNNGSGKSAVLTGITMALGGSAKNTVRSPLRSNRVVARLIVRAEPSCKGSWIRARRRQVGFSRSDSGGPTRADAPCPSYALCSVRIKNRGTDAYQPAVYGQSITVERRIGKDSGSYKLKNHEGKVVDTKKATLDAIRELSCAFGSPGGADACAQSTTTTSKSRTP